MKEDNLKDIWNLINEPNEPTVSWQSPKSQFIISRSKSVQNKIRRMLHKDLIVKTVSGLAFILTLLLYRETENVIYICVVGLLFQAIMVTIEVKLLQQFNSVSDLGQNTRDNLSGILTLLKRKTHLYEITIASTQVMVFVPGLLIYFFIMYGQVKYLAPFDYFVFSVLVLIGTVITYLRVRSQLKFHIRHITASITDLNENTLEFVMNTIEKQRKQDDLIKGLVGLLLIIGFVALLAILKAIVGLPV